MGLVIYAGLVAWSWYFMPSAFLFVLPGAIVGAYSRRCGRGRCWGRRSSRRSCSWSLALLWPAGATGDFTQLSRQLDSSGL